MRIVGCSVDDVVHISSLILQDVDPTYVFRLNDTENYNGVGVGGAHKKLHYMGEGAGWLVAKIAYG